MAVKMVNLDFNDLPIPEAYIRVDRVFGGKREGWTALCTIYVSAATANPLPVKVGERQKVVDGKRQVGADGNPVMEAVMATPEPKRLREFNVTCPWVANGVPEQLLYAALKTRPEYAGAVDC